MGIHADDLSEDYSHEFSDTKPTIWVPIECKFKVTIIHRITGDEHWSCIVTADSPKDAQKQFRKQYAHVRSQYDHSYCLLIKQIK